MIKVYLKISSLLLVSFLLISLVIAQEDEEYFLESSDGAVNIASHPSFQTQLFVEIQTQGDFEDNKDVFKVTVKVTNIGDFPAFFTKVKLNNIPNDWKVSPPLHTIPFILPDETQIVKFTVKRSATDSSIFATAKAINSEEATSEIIPIPIFLTTTLLIITTISFLSLHFYRKNGSNIR